MGCANSTTDRVCAELGPRSLTGSLPVPTLRFYATSRAFQVWTTARLDVAGARRWPGGVFTLGNEPRPLSVCFLKVCLLSWPFE
jgi:hypothetical protein